MAKSKYTDEQIKQFIKAGGRKGAKVDLDKVLAKASKEVDKKA